MQSNDPPDVRIADLATFLRVRRSGSVTGAARELQVTPSQVSKSIARLERQLSVKLLSRTARGVRVSDAGQRLAPDLEEIVGRAQALVGEPAAANSELAVAAPSYLLSLLLPVIADALPGVSLRGFQLPPALIRHYASERLYDLTLLSGSGRMPDPWAITEIGSIRKGLFATPSVAKQLGPAPISPDRLKDLLFVGPIYNANGQFVPVDDDCPMPYAERRHGHQTQTIALALELGARTGQVVYGPVMAARTLLDAHRLVEVRVQGWDVEEELFLACDADRVLARVQTTLCSALRKAVHQMQ